MITFRDNPEIPLNRLSRILNLVGLSLFILTIILWIPVFPILTILGILQGWKSFSLPDVFVLFVVATWAFLLAGGYIYAIAMATVKKKS